MPKLHLDRTKWSYSRVTSFEQCPLSWWYSYHYKINRDINNAFSEYGSIGHRIIERQMIFKMNNCNLMSNEQMKEEFKSEFYQMKNKFLSSSMKKSYLYDGIDYFDKWDSFDGYKVKSVERFVDFDVLGYNCIGGMDLLLEKDDKLFLIDHKSSKEYTGIKMDEKIKQLYFYGHVVNAIYDKFPEYIGFNFFRKNTLRIMDWDTKKFEETTKWFGDRIKEIEDTKKFEASPDKFFCDNLCNHRFTCKRGRG